MKRKGQGGASRKSAPLASEPAAQDFSSLARQASAAPTKRATCVPAREAQAHPNAARCVKDKPPAGKKEQEREARILAARRRSRLAVLLGISASLEAAFELAGKTDRDGTVYEPLDFPPQLRRRLDAQMVKWLRHRRALIAMDGVPGLEGLRLTSALHRDMDSRQRLINARIIDLAPAASYTEAFGAFCLCLGFFLWEHVRGMERPPAPARFFEQSFRRWGEMMVPVSSPLNVIASRAYFDTRAEVMADQDCPDFDAMGRSAARQSLDDNPLSPMAEAYRRWEKDLER